MSNRNIKPFPLRVVTHPVLEKLLVGKPGDECHALDVCSKDPLDRDCLAIVSHPSVDEIFRLTISKSGPREWGIPKLNSLAICKPAKLSKFCSAMQRFGMIGLRLGFEVI